MSPLVKLRGLCDSPGCSIGRSMYRKRGYFAGVTGIRTLTYKQDQLLKAIREPGPQGTGNAVDF